MKMATGDDLKGEMDNYSVPLSQNENVKADCSFITNWMESDSSGSKYKGCIVLLLYWANYRRQGI